MAANHVKAATLAVLAFLSVASALIIGHPTKGSRFFLGDTVPIVFYFDTEEVLPSSITLHLYRKNSFADDYYIGIISSTSGIGFSGTIDWTISTSLVVADNYYIHAVAGSSTYQTSNFIIGYWGYYVTSPSIGSIWVRNRFPSRHSSSPQLNPLYSYPERRARDHPLEAIVLCDCE